MTTPASERPAVLLLEDSPASAPPTTPEWACSSVVVPYEPATVAEALHRLLSDPEITSVLCWAQRLGPVPPLSVLRELLSDPGIDVAHAGLQLGLGNLPRRHQQVAPTWMLSLDPPAENRGTSWRVSLEAALIRTAVVSQVGGLDPHFDTVTGVGLEAGHRWIRSGAFVIGEPALLAHLPSSVGQGAASESPIAPEPPTDADEIRFLLRRHGLLWAGLALVTQPRASGVWSNLRPLIAESSVATGILDRVERPLLVSPTPGTVPLSVSVLIPTIDRAPWLRVVLDQLRCQTVTPHEVVVVDQSGDDHVDPDIAADFADLPLTYRRQFVEGQSTARNEALGLVTGDVVLFLDDDDEVEPDLIERHLETLTNFGADVCSGVADEPTSGELPADFTYIRSGDVLGTNNASVRRSMLERVGGFDLAFDHGPRADLDLGIRLHLAGARMVLDPSIRVLHHRAPRGGLRTFEARAVTRGSSRQAIFETVPSAATELYLWHRHFGPVRRRQAERIRRLSALAGSGSRRHNAARFVVQAAKIVFGANAASHRTATAEAAKLLAAHPTIDRPLTTVSS